MVDRLWQRLMTNSGYYTPGHTSYRRVFLLNLTLLVTSGTFAFFVASGLLVTKRYTLSAVLLVALAVMLGLLHYFKATNKLEITAGATVAAMLATLVVYLVMSQNHRYALYWCAIVPPITYSLLGLRKAHFVNATFYAVVLSYVFATYPSWSSAEFAGSSIVNIGAATTALVLITAHMESSRQSTQAVLEEANRELARLSVTDKLTGLYNRTKLDAILEYEAVRSMREGSGLGVLIIDVDWLKSINDAYGHMAGDSVLVGIAELLLGSCRQVDFVGRWGGDEFIVLSPGADSDGVANIAERVLEGVRGRIFGEIGPVSVSIGTATYRDGDTADSVLRRADAALYAAKAAGRGCALSGLGDDGGLIG